MFKLLFCAVLILPIAYFMGSALFDNRSIEIPQLPESNWGPADKVKDTSIKPFKINVSKNVIENLNRRLSEVCEFVPTLENAAWTYGISSKYLREVLNYWKDKYNWHKRQELLNKYPQFITNIQGLDIHFYHVKPSKLYNNQGNQLKVLPILIVHGWSGSVVEFQKIIPLLTTPQPGKDFVFELVVPSLPGYAFSGGAIRPGLGPAQMSVIFKNLMERLGFEKYYTQGGDWGAVITSDLSVLYPDRVYGAHVNWPLLRFAKPSMWLLLGSIFPSLVVESEYQSRIYPLKSYLGILLEETGYFHEQATKPDTIGIALSDSPAGLAAYLLEKWSTLTNLNNKYKEDGGLLEKFTMDELLDNIMIYWVTRSITTSIRIYAETFRSGHYAQFDHVPITVPFACANFPHELVYVPESIARTYIKNLIQFTHMPRGGHYATLEEPKLFSDDVWSFVDKVEKMRTSNNSHS